MWDRIESDDQLVDNGKTGTRLAGGRERVRGGFTLFGLFAVNPIGLDVGARTVKAVQRRGRRACTIALPRDTEPGAPWTVAEAQRLRNVLARRGFTGRDVVVAAPKRAALTSVLDLPPRKSGVPVDQIAATELALAHRREPEGMQVVSWELPPAARTGEGLTVVAAGCPHADADALMAPLEHAGFRVLGMDLEAWALARISSVAPPANDQILAIADLGWSTGTLVLLYQGSVVYERQLSAAGIGALAASLQREHHFPADAVDYLLFETGFEAEQRGQADDWRLLMKGRPQLESHFDALSRELTLSVRYAQHQYPQATVDRVVLSGGGAAVPGLTNYLTPMLDVPTQLVSPAAVLQIDDAALASPVFAVAGGLSLWGETAEEATPCAA